MTEPIFTLRDRTISPYGDFFRMYLKMNFIITLVMAILLAVGVGYSIYLMTLPIDFMAIAVFIAVGVAVLLLLVMIFLVPMLNRRATAKNATKLEIRFYADRLIALPAGQEEMGRGVAIYYKEFNDAFETKTSIVCLKGKAGLIFSKADNLPEEVKTLLLAARKK